MTTRLVCNSEHVPAYKKHLIKEGIKVEVTGRFTNNTSALSIEHDDEKEKILVETILATLDARFRPKRE